MKTERFEIKNRHGLKLVIQVDTPDNPTNLAFIAHGQGGFIEQKHIEAFTQAFLENDYRVVRFDATNSIGESGGKIEDVTTTNYLKDLEDVITWARSQDWFKEPFALCGHSMGGMSTALYAENHPEQISLLIPASAVINYELSASTRDPNFLKNWQEKGYDDQPSFSKPGVMKRVGWGYMEDLKKYNLLKNADKLTMPVLMMAGDKDNGTPIRHQKLLLDAIPSENKKLIEVKDADHNYRGTDDYEASLDQIKAAISSWLKEINT